MDRDWILEFKENGRPFFEDTDRDKVAEEEIRRHLREAAFKADIEYLRERIASVDNLLSQPTRTMGHDEALNMVLDKMMERLDSLENTVQELGRCVTEIFRALRGHDDKLCKADHDISGILMELSHHLVPRPSATVVMTQDELDRLSSYR